MINKISALSLANEVLVKFAMAGFQSSLSVGSDGCTPRVEVSVFYDNDTAVDAIELLLSIPKHPSVSVDASHSEHAQWFTIYFLFES